MDRRSETTAELIARITAEHDASVVSTARHRMPDGFADPEVDAPVDADPEVGAGTTAVTRGAARTTVTRKTATRKVASRNAVTRAAAPAVTREEPETVVTRDEPRERTLLGRLAPLAVGAVVMLIATVAVAVVRPDFLPSPEPDLSSVLVDADDNVEAAPPDLDAAEDPELLAPSDPTGIAAEPDVTVPPPVAAPPAEDPATWELTGEDGFDTGLSPAWTVFDTDGRSADAVTVQDGVLTVRGDAEGRTGGLSWTEPSQYGRWEVRARFPQGDPQYHPVLLLWPTQVSWPAGGEVDFAETASGSDRVSFFLHHGEDNSQLYAEHEIDITEWHDYVVEWTPDRITGYVDGTPYFESTDAATLPPGPMQLSLQLDYRPEAGAPAPTEMQVDSVRMFR